MIAGGVLEVELIERIFQQWEQKVCYKCANDVKKRYEDTPPIEVEDKDIKNKNAKNPRKPPCLDTIFSSRNGSFVTNKYMAEQICSQSNFQKRYSDCSSIPTAHPEYEKQMQKLEKDFRTNLKTEFEMNLWID